MNNISLREFARRLSISEGAVRKAIKEGKINTGVQYDANGKPTIIPDVALSEWGKTYNPNYDRNPALYQKLDEAAGANVQAGDAGHPGNRSTAELKRLLSEIRVQKEAIELRKTKGELVDKKKVYAQLFQMGQEVRSALQAVPDRVIDGIIAARDRSEAHTILTLAINEALNTLSEIQKREITGA
ncbi:MAG: hypothetical protein ACR2K1_00150 [Saprospiraceae bacterium]